MERLFGCCEKKRRGLVELGLIHGQMAIAVARSRPKRNGRTSSFTGSDTAEVRPAPEGAVDQVTTAIPCSSWRNGSHAATKSGYGGDRAFLPARTSQVVGIVAHFVRRVDRCDPAALGCSRFPHREASDRTRSGTRDQAALSGARHHDYRLNIVPELVGSCFHTMPTTIRCTADADALWSGSRVRGSPAPLPW